MEEEELVYASDLDLQQLWDNFHGTRWEFLDHLRGLVRDPHVINEILFCDSCAYPVWEDDTIGTLGGSLICESCLHDNYSYCDDCDGYYHDEDTDDHRHDGGCDCEAPQQSFKVRNDGYEPLANDTRATITLPKGTISAEGLTAIKRYLNSKGDYTTEDGYSYYRLAAHLEQLGDEWQTKQGNFAKRLSRLAYQKYQIKLTPEVMSQVGVIARDHSNQVEVDIEVTRNLNLSPDEFCNEDSCWWGGYSESRCALKSNGGFGLRSFPHNSYGSYVSGRAWVMPLRKDLFGNLNPTFDTETPDAFVVFNGYGDLSGYTAPRILAHMAGWTYRKIGFACSPMYINAGGYLVAPEEIAEQYTDGKLNLAVNQHSALYANEANRRTLARVLANA